MMLARRSTPSIVVIGLALMGMSCGNPPSEPSDYPKPGEMRVVSIEEIMIEKTPVNLIANGSFNEWYSGAPMPTGFVAPKDPAISSIQRRNSPDGPGRYLVEQVWSQSDASAPPSELFHTVVKGLKPDTAYRLEVNAVPVDNATVSISVWELKSAKELGGRWPNLIETGLEENGNPANTFATNKTGAILIAAHANDRTEFPAQVLWREWRLTEAPEDLTAEPVRAELPPKLVMSKPSTILGHIELKPGEDLVCSGWFIADKDVAITFTLNDREGEASYYSRPDLEKSYSEYAHRTGWTIRVPAGELEATNTLTIFVGGKKERTTVVKVTTPKSEASPPPK